jgi:phosphatidylglycerophosphate synthase
MPSLWAVPNLLSLSRIVVAPILYALIVSTARYALIVALILFIAASLTDTVDGEIARRRRLVSALGIYLDTTSDKILIAILLVGLAVVHELFEAEVTRLAGPKGKHDPERRAYRHGQEAR